MRFEETRRRLADNERASHLLEVLVRTYSADPEATVYAQRTGWGVMVMGADAKVTRQDIADLVELGLIRTRRFGAHADLLEPTTNGKAFHRWLYEEAAAVEQVTREAVNLVNGADFEAAHPVAAKALREALALVPAIDDVARGEIGNHLVGALTDVVQAVAGLPVPDEKVDRATAPIRRAADERGDRALQAMVELALAVMDLDQGIKHWRDEVKAGRPVASDETIRRAAWLTAVVCYEFHRSTSLERHG